MLKIRVPRHGILILVILLLTTLHFPIHQRAKLLQQQYAIVAVGRNRKPRARANYHDYAVFIVHYHKTGYVLSRELKNLVNDLEMMMYEQRKKRKGQRNRKDHAPKEEKNVRSLQQRLQQQRQHQPEQRKKSNRQEQPQHHQYHFDKEVSRRSRHAHFEESGLLNPAIPTSTRIRFDQIGNWVRSAFPVRWHDKQTSCPTGLGLRPGAMYIQESPDLFCDENVLEKALVRGEVLAGGGMRMERLSRKRRRTDGGEGGGEAGSANDGDNGGKRIRDNGPPIKYSRLHRHDASTTKHTNTTPVKVKIVHFVRNPFEMVISNYRYHSQDPTPEKWVHIDDPCQHLYGDGVSLADHVIPTLASGWNNHSPIELDSSSHNSSSSSYNNTLRQTLSDITSLCHTLYRSDPATRNKTFYEHLRHHLDEWDGLRLSTAQMIAASSAANGHLAGGDVLRMANNVVRLEGLRAREERWRRRADDSGSDDNYGDLQLLTISMDDFIENVAENTMKFMDFVFDSGDGGIDYDSQEEDDYYSNPIIPRNVLWEAAKYQDEYYATKHKKSHHITAQSKSSEKKDEWKALLRNSPELGPILSQTEVLVSKALLIG
mmetsp:Transcript_1588/g.3372  ORF Transcript_1588/g.3372 Transcript_1588/m.3372 type:complete len:600 (+) Transcript_1588:13-1812(+)